MAASDDCPLCTCNLHQADAHIWQLRDQTSTCKIVLQCVAGCAGILYQSYKHLVPMFSTDILCWLSCACRCILSRAIAPQDGGQSVHLASECSMCDKLGRCLGACLEGDESGLLGRECLKEGLTAPLMLPGHTVVAGNVAFAFAWLFSCLSGVTNLLIAGYSGMLKSVDARCSFTSNEVINGVCERLMAKLAVPKRRPSAAVTGIRLVTCTLL